MEPWVWKKFGAQKGYFEDTVMANSPHNSNISLKDRGQRPGVSDDYLIACVFRFSDFCLLGSGT